MGLSVSLALLVLCVYFFATGDSSLKPIEEAPTCGYQSCHAVDPSKITVHLIPHSHDDVGWVKTVDQYYYGGDPTNEGKNGIQYIIGSSLEALKLNPDRRFIQVETAFFWKWWQNQEEKARRDYRHLVDHGQIEMVSGGWSMNDEATANYQSIIDQMTWGLRILNDTLGSCGRPRVGWQIDPFGHSKEQALIFKRLGFDGVFVVRADFNDRTKRRAEGTMDLLWEPSSNNDNVTLFTSMFSTDLYYPPSGFCWDVLCNDERMNDDANSPQYNVEDKVRDFTSIIESYLSDHSTNNILIPMGGDFFYQGAHIGFNNIDKLIRGFKDFSKDIEVIYSTPSCYIKAVNEAALKNNISYTVKTDDYFPYSSELHMFWSGFYTSRPNSKRFEREGNNILQAMKQLTTFAKLEGDDYEQDITPLKEVMGILQHHDAITGTEKNNVVHDYVRILYTAIQKSQQHVSYIISNLLNAKQDKGLSENLNLTVCLLTNVSICEGSTDRNFSVAIYNPLSHPVSHFVHLPVEGVAYKIADPEGNFIVNDIKDPIATFVDFQQYGNPGSKNLIFEVKDVPAMGLKLYRVEEQTEMSSGRELHDSLIFGTNRTGFELDPETNLLKSVTIDGITLQIKQEFMSYIPQAELKTSGAYIFRPDGDAKTLYDVNKFAVNVSRGELVDEVKQIYNDWITQIIRVYKNSGYDYIEFDWLVGPIDTSTSSYGREIITRLTVTDFDNEGVFYTDSNGRQMLRRELFKRPTYDYDTSAEPIASNYYPVTSKITIKDEAKQMKVALLTDRAEGGSSLSNGSIELMVHRRLLFDDHLGVDEALNEQEFGKPVVTRGQIWLTFGSSEAGTTANRRERDLTLRKLNYPVVLVGNLPSASLEETQSNKYGPLKIDALPENINILTLESWKSDTYLLRLEHIFERDEDDILSTPVSVDLKGIFVNYNVTEIQEMTLGANRPIEELNDTNTFKWTTKDGDVRGYSKHSDIVNGSQVTLQPMDIKTYIVKLVKND